MQSGFRRHLIAAVTLAAGISLAALALPRAVAGLIMVPGNSTLADIQDGRPVDENSLVRAAASREGALGWAADGRLLTDLALVRLMLVERKPVVRSDLDLHPIRRDLVRGLAIAPLNPYAWARLAYLDYVVADRAPKAAQILPAAILSGPSERRLHLLRAELGFRLWGDLKGVDRRLVLRQAGLAWAQDPFRTLGVARQADRIDLLRRALAGEPDRLVVLEKLLDRGF